MMVTLLVKVMANGHDVTASMPRTASRLAAMAEAGSDRRRPKPKIKLMLDSGAFSAWKSGNPINLQDYIAYLLHNQHLLHSYVALDDIPGKPSRLPTQTEVDEAAKASHRNLKVMHKAGLKPMPVFHFGESFDWLYRLLDEGEDYIGLGGLVGRPQAAQVDFLDRVFTIITDSTGLPTVHTHGFGVASFDMLQRYPFTTADATSWMMTAVTGGIYVPLWRGPNPDFSRPPVKLTMSRVERSSGVPPDHYLRLGPMMRERVAWYLNECKITLAEAEESYEARGRAVVRFLLQYQDALGVRHFRHRIRGVVGAIGSLDTNKVRPTQVVFAGEGAWCTRVLVSQGAMRVLRSYHFSKDCTEAELARYVPIQPPPGMAKAPKQPRAKTKPKQWGGGWHAMQRHKKDDK